MTHCGEWQLTLIGLRASFPHSRAGDIESGAYKISLAPFDVVKILRGTVEAHAKTATSRRLTLELNLPQNNLPHALTDPVPLRQIFSSLVENAMKYTPEGGEIVVAASRINKGITIEFTDSGCGVREEDLPHIFEKFYRGRPLGARAGTGSNADDRNTGDDEYFANETSGIGLGLYLVHNLIEQIGGEILVDSPANETRRGAKFTVLLPVAQ